MVGPRGLAVDAPHGQRWELALELLCDPEATETVLSVASLCGWIGRLDSSPARTHSPSAFGILTYVSRRLTEPILQQTPKRPHDHDEKYGRNEEIQGAREREGSDGTEGYHSR